MITLGLCGAGSAISCVNPTFVFLVFFAFCYSFSFARKAVFEKSVVAPSASGKVKVKKDNNNNYEISVSVKDLATPANLIPAKKAYLVWSEAGNGVFNIG